MTVCASLTQTADRATAQQVCGVTLPDVGAVRWLNHVETALDSLTARVDVPVTVHQSVVAPDVVVLASVANNSLYTTPIV